MTQPATDASIARPSSFTKEELRACGEGRLFKQAGPRLPIDHMIMVDRITHISTKGDKQQSGKLVAELDINPDLWFFQCHFLEDPVMPGCLGIDALWQLTGFYLGWLGYQGNGRALGASDVRFSGEVLPSAKCVRYTLNIKRVIQKNLTMGIADGTVESDGKVIYVASRIKAGVVPRKDSA